MLIYVDSRANNNKFYSVELAPDGLTVTKRWGRVGAHGQTAVEMTGRTGYDNAIYAKERKGYEKVSIAAVPAATTSVAANTQIAAIAKNGLTKGKARTDTRVHDLIERICKVNAHDIAKLSGGKITVDTSGQIKTPLGLVTATSISDARRILADIEKAGGVKDTETTRLLERYLTLIPQDIGRTAGWATTFFNKDNTFAKQGEFLDSLRDSINFFQQQVAAAVAKPADEDGNEYDDLFKYKIRAVADGGEVFKRIEKLYESTKNTNHDASRLKVKHVFELIDPVGAEKYKKIASEIRNEQQMWHGTRAANLLSILSKGLFVPARSGSGIQIAGRMFGDGIYASLQSSKATMYSSGFWTAGGRENNCFVLLTDVAMGSEYRPTSPSDAVQNARTTKNKFGKPWNSINVKAGTAGVRNHEAIIWNSDQMRIRYVVELDA